MRYVLAIAALVISGVLLTFGIGQRTFLAGPAEISFPVESQSESAYAIIDGEQFEKVPGQANVVVRGAHGFVATGATRDVEAWLEPFAHDQVTVDTSGQRLLSATIAALPSEADEEPQAPLDPRGSDLWLEERVTPGDEETAESAMLRVPVALREGQSVLIAADGEQPMPQDVSLVWAQNRETPWAGPLLAAGGLFALLGGVLYVLAIDHDRRGLGPRRGRRGPLQGIRNSFRRRSRAVAETASGGDGSGDGNTTMQAEDLNRAARRVARLRRGAALPALSLAVVLGVSGCSADYWPKPAPEPTEETEEEPAPTPSSVAPVPVTDAQLSRIVERIAEVSGEADEALDIDLLEERFDGDALVQRTANYTLRANLPGERSAPPRITDRELDYELVQSTESWPRTIFVTVESEPGDVEESDAEADSEDGTGDATADIEAAEEEASSNASPSLAMILTQESPQDNYRVSRVIALRGGISMPQAAPAEEGTALLANDIESLELPPGEVGAAFAAVLQNGIEAPEAELFDIDAEDSMLQNYGKALAERAQAQADEREETMVASSNVFQADTSTVALSTGVGGALVATTVIDEQISDADGGRFKPKAEKAVTVLSGLEGEQERIVQEVAHQLLFYVPSRNSDEKIQLLGVTSELVGARN